MYQGKATYHNGMEAKAHELMLAFDIETGKLTFEFEGETKTWPPYSYHFEKRGSTLILFNKADYSNFEINDPDFAVPYLQRFDSITQASLYTKLIRSGFAAHIFIALITLGFIFFMSQYAIPFAAEKSVYLIPHSLDNRLGKTYYDQYMYYQTEEYNKTQLVQKFTDQLELNSEKKIKVTVIDSDMVNAFALPSGHVIVYTGLLNKMERYEELAALLSHEVSHVNHRHSMRSLLRELSGRLFLSAIVGDVSRFTDVIISNAGKLQGLSYSRELESEADSEGLRILKQNKINTIGFTLLFERLSDASDGLEPPEFLTTHPMTKKRIEEAKKHPDKGINHPELEAIFNKVSGNQNRREN